MTDFPSVSAGKKSRPSAFPCAPCVKWQVPASRRSSLRAPAALDRGRRRGFFAVRERPLRSAGVHRQGKNEGWAEKVPCGIVCASAALSFRYKNRGAYDGRRRKRLFPAKPLYSALTTTCCFFACLLFLPLRLQRIFYLGTATVRRCTLAGKREPSAAAPAAEKGLCH